MPRPNSPHPAASPISPGEVMELANLADFPLEHDALPVITGYLSLLMQWNRKMNLVGAESWQAAFSDLVADCLHLADFIASLPLPAAPETWDPGAGAGLPGIPLRAVWKAGTYFMIEPREKRSLFLQNVLARHPLPGVSVVESRLEPFMERRKQADCIVSRAFMPWDKLLPLIENKLAPHGLVVFMANEAPPLDLPAPWHVCASHVYQSGCMGMGRQPTRHFWALGKTGRV